MILRQAFLLTVAIGLYFPSMSQNDGKSSRESGKVPRRLVDNVERKTDALTSQLERKVGQHLRKLEKQEELIINGLKKFNSHFVRQEVTSDRTFNYNALITCIKNAGATRSGLGTEYLPYSDSLSVLLKYFGSGSTGANDIRALIIGSGETLEKFKALQGKIGESERIAALIKDRQRYLTNLLGKYSQLPRRLKNALGGYKEQYYYYTQQLREYRQLLNEPDKLLVKALALVRLDPRFNEFMAKNSMLGSLFSIPSAYGKQGDLSGLQTIDQVKNLVLNKAGGASSGANAFKEGVAIGQQQLGALNDKLGKMGIGSGSMEMPDFKPNSQKSKTFLKRLEFGTNFQTNRGTGFYPNSLELGLSLGYKLNDKSIAGVGLSYRIGLGKDYQHMEISNQGIGLRSFIDIRLKKGFFASGGLEYNYQSSFTSLAQLYGFDPWQKSGLVGVSKIVSIKSAVVKKTKVQFLWDIFSYQNRPQTQPFKFRIGYSF